MQYPSRNADERDYIRRLERLSASQRSRLRELLGSPPNPANVPDSFWREVEDEAQRENFLALYFIFQRSSDFHLDGADGATSADTVDTIGDEGDAFAEALSSGMGSRWADTARKRFDKASERMRKAEEPTGPDGKGGGSAMTKQDLENELAIIFSPDDAAGAAAYGMTSAESAGGEAAAKHTFGQTAADKWKTNPHLTRSGPCERCKAMDGQPRTVWEPIYPGGPPIHEYCACEVRYDNVGEGI